MFNVKKLVLLTISSMLLVVVFVVATPHRAYAALDGNGPASNWYPDPSNSSKATWMVSELCSIDTTKCQKGALSFVEIYVPTTMVNQSINIALVDGCDSTGADTPGGFPTYGYTATTFFTVLNGASNAAVSSTITSDEPGCPGIGSMNLAFTATPSYTAGQYYVYYLQTQAWRSQADGWSWYLNQFAPVATTGSVLVGVTDQSFSCSRFFYPRSCPNTDVAYTSISAFARNGVQWGEEISFATPCNSGPQNGTIIIYDADHTIYQNNMIFTLNEYDRTSGAFIGTVASTLVDGQNDEIWGFQGGRNASSGYTYKDTSKYTLTVQNIGDSNSLQVKIPFKQVNAQLNCGSPAMSCTIVGGAIIVSPGATFSRTYSVSNASSGGISWSNAASYRFGVNGVNAGAPHAPLPNEVQSNFVVQPPWAPDTTYYHYPMTVDPLAAGASFSITVSFTAPSVVGVYPFDWGMVQEGVGWIPGSCNDQVQVVNTPPNGTVSSNCTVISAFAVDPDWPAQAIIRILIDGFNVTGDVNTLPPGRTYTYTIPTSYLDGAAHAVTLLASDYDRNGVVLSYPTVASTSFTCGKPIDTSQNRVRIGCKINGHILDPSSPGSSLVLGVSIDGGAFFTDPSWKTDLSASQLPPDQDNIGSGGNGISVTNYFGDYNSHNVTLIAYGVNSAGVPDGVNTTWGPVLVGACTPSCTSLSTFTSPSNPEANQPFTITNLRWSYKQGTLQGAAINDWSGYSITISVPDASFNGSLVPPGYNSANIAALFTFPTVGTGGNGDLTAPLGNFTISTAGIHHIKMTVTGPQFKLICDSTVAGRTTDTTTTPVTVTDNWNPIKIVNKPYIKVFEGDVSAGGGFKVGASPCPVVSSASSGIKTWGLGSGGLWAGSSVEYAAFAINTIDSGGGRGFYSGSQTHNLASYNGTYTSFANTVSPPGTFDAAIGHCVPDFYNTTQLTGVAPTPIVTGSFNLCSAVSNTQYIANSSLILNVTGACAVSGFTGRVTIYVPGNVTIPANIAYPAITYPANASPASVPYLTIIALGNIYINSGVTLIDGLYIAQPNGGSGGNIYTCANSGAIMPATNVYDNCRNQLRVNGSLIAKSISMERSVGTVSSAVVGETATSTNIAEIYTQGPESYLGAPLFKPVLNSVIDSKPGVQSVTSLSPLF